MVSYFPFHSHMPLCFRTGILLPCSPSLSREHVLRWKNICLGINHILPSVQPQTSSCFWLSPWIYDTSVFMYIKELSRLVQWLPIHGFFFHGIFNSIVLGYMSLTLWCLPSSLFWAPWGWGPYLFHFNTPSTLCPAGHILGAQSVNRKMKQWMNELMHS